MPLSCLARWQKKHPHSKFYLHLPRLKSFSLVVLVTCLVCLGVGSCQKQLAQRFKSSTKEPQKIRIYRRFALMISAPAIICLLSLHLVGHELWNLSHWSSLCVSYLKWAIIPYISNRWGHCLMFPFHFLFKLFDVLVFGFVHVSSVSFWVSTVWPLELLRHAAICISYIREVCLLPHLSWMSVYRWRKASPSSSCQLLLTAS